MSLKNKFQVVEILIYETVRQAVCLNKFIFYPSKMILLSADFCKITLKLV